jgi:hypothetical protein
MEVTMKKKRVKVVAAPTPSKLDVPYLVGTKLPAEMAMKVEMVANGYNPRGFRRAVRHAIARGESSELARYL